MNARRAAGKINRTVHPNSPSVDALKTNIDVPNAVPSGKDRREGVNEFHY